MVIALLCWAGDGLLAAPPAGHILDDTRALSSESRDILADELKFFGQDLKCDAWIMTSSFTANGVTIRRQAQLSRLEWSGRGPSVLMAYDRASNGSALSFSPEFWARYPSAELIEIMQETHRVLTNPKLTLDERILVATRAWIDRLRVMESVRIKQTLWIQRGEKRFAVYMAVGLAGTCLLAVVLGIFARQRDARAEHQFLFPRVLVGTRFGAAFGGGVTAEINTSTASH